MAMDQSTAGLLSALLGQQANATGQSQLQTGATQSLGALGTGYTTARGDIGTGLQQGIGALGTGYNTATGALGTQYGQAQDYLGQGVAGFNPYATAGAGAVGLYSNALGLGGTAGNSAAQSAFQASPGYQYSVDQATDQAARKAASLGIAGSGNTLDAVTRLSQNLANQDYSNWLQNLSGLSNQGLSAAGSQLQGLGQQASTATQYGQNQADLATGYGTNQAGLYGNAGSSLANLATGYGQNQAGVYTGLGQNQANLGLKTAELSGKALTDAAAAEAARKQQSSGLGSAIAGGLNLGSSLLGGGGLSSLGSSLTSFFR